MPGLFDGSPWERPVTCEVCGHPRDTCKCPRNAQGAITRPQDQPARVHRERRAGGKIVTIISGLDPVATDLPALLRMFKTTLGAGGALLNPTAAHANASQCPGQIELQGDHRDKLVTALQKLGYPAKPAGG